MKFSIIIPARDEEKYIPKCLDTIDVAAKPFPDDVEVIVVLNRCTDKTEEIARNWGAKVVHDNSKNLSKIRNAGARRATGDIIVTIDADSWMSPNMLTEIDQKLKSGKFVGGGVRIHPERYSIGIWIAVVMLKIWLFFKGEGGGLFWCFRRDFEAVGGFDETLVIGEDLDFARRLKKYGKQQHRKFTIIRRAFIMTSCRKFDHFGDWLGVRFFVFGFKNIFNALGKGLRGEHQEFANHLFYDFKRPGQEATDSD